MAYRIANGSNYGRSTHLNERKSLKKEAERQHGKPTQWIGGTLYFADGLTPVPNIRQVPKPGTRAIGLEGAQPKPTPKVDRFAARHDSRGDRYRSSARF